jgi:hypothetical protein
MEETSSACWCRATCRSIHVSNGGGSPRAITSSLASASSSYLAPTWDLLAPTWDLLDPCSVLLRIHGYC